MAPVLGTAHPTGYPSYVLLGWLASLLLAPVGEPALRMNLLSAILLGVAAGLTVVLVRRLTGRTPVAVAAGVLLALTPIPWRVGSFADPHMLHLALVAGLLVLLVGLGGAGPERPGGRRPLARRRGRALRRRAGQPGAHPPARPRDRPLHPGGRAAGLAPPSPAWTMRPAPSSVSRRSLYLELPIRAAMGAPLVYGHPDTWDGFWYVVLGAQFTRRDDRTLHGPRGQGRRAGPGCDRPVRPARRAHPGRLPDRGRPPTAVRPPHGDVARHHLLVRGFVHERRHRALLPGPDPHRHQLARDRGRGAARRGRRAAARAARRRGEARDRAAPGGQRHRRRRACRARRHRRPGDAARWWTSRPTRAPRTGAAGRSGSWSRTRSSSRGGDTRRPSGTASSSSASGRTSG